MTLHQHPVVAAELLDLAAAVVHHLGRQRVVGADGGQRGEHAHRGVAALEDLLDPALGVEAAEQVGIVAVAGAGEDRPEVEALVARRVLEQVALHVDHRHVVAEGVERDVGVDHGVLGHVVAAARLRAAVGRVVLADPDDDGPELPAAFDPADGTSPERDLLSRDIRRRIAEALVALSPRQRAVFVMKHYEEKSIAEIGEATGLDEGTIKSHLFRAARKLRERLEDLR